MRRKQFWVYENIGDVLTLCAVVFAWEVSCIAVFSALALLLDRLPFPLYVAGVTLMVSPVVYAAVAVMAFFRGSRGGRNP